MDVLAKVQTSPDLLVRRVFQANSPAENDIFAVDKAGV
jgi:hypothetical protein